MIDSEHPTDPSPPPPREEPTDHGGHEPERDPASTIDPEALAGLLMGIRAEVAALRRDLTIDQDDARDWRRRTDATLARIEATLANGAGSLEIVAHEHRRHGQRLAEIEAAVNALPCHGRMGCPTAAE